MTTAGFLLIHPLSPLIFPLRNTVETPSSQEPGVGYADLLPCPNKVVILDGHYTNDTTQTLDAETAASLGLSPLPYPDNRALTGEQIRRVREFTGAEPEPRDLGDEEGGNIGQGTGDGNDNNSRRNSDGPFDLSVLCTVVNDVNHLMKPTYPVDSRLVDALLWNVKVRWEQFDIKTLWLISKYQNGLYPLTCYTH